jgi:hypothetical protein
MRPAAPVAIPATTAAFDPPLPFWLLRELLWPLLEDAEEVRRDDALDRFPLALLALDPDRGLLLEPVERLLAEPVERLLAEPVEGLLPEPVDRLLLVLFLLDDPLFACAITPPWVLDNFGSKCSTPDGSRKTRLG